MLDHVYFTPEDIPQCRLDVCFVLFAEVASPG